MHHPRSFEDLRANALYFWPPDIAVQEQESSVIPRLIETQGKFISILHVADASPTAWREVLAKTTHFPPNLFLKHLMVLADIGGEPLKRLKAELHSVFGNATMDFTWRDGEHSHRLVSLAGRGGWDNKSLCVDGAGLVASRDLTPAMEDVAMLLLFGGAALNPGAPAVLLEKCIIGGMIGNKEQLDRFVRQRYIWVSRITGGATANTLGHLAESYVRERLQSLLPDWDFSKKTLPGISQTGGRTDIAFDLVAQSPNARFCAIEISFQFTTNSTIERKAGQARSRHALLARNGHSIAYVIDGAGNFERTSALATICRYSDCTVTFKDSEIEGLARFLEAISKKGNN
jgi:hypothetical protein